MRFYDVPGGAEQLPVVSCGGRARLYYIGTRSLSGLRCRSSVGGCESLGEKFFRWRWARRRRCCGGTGSSRDACDLHLALPCRRVIRCSVVAPWPVCYISSCVLVPDGLLKLPLGD